ncbi:MAG: subclass B3 metallo-beta-lactamase [bacterium]
MLLVVLAATPAVIHAQTAEDRTQDRVAFPAHKIIGNLHYVGTGTLNSYLITTPQGHILINTNFEETVPLLQASVEKIGFKMADIRIILGSHAHGDHMQADAIVKELTGGAMVMAMEQDVPALKGMKAPSGKPHPIDRVLKDGEQVTLGGATLTAHLTPGHTRGCTTWRMTVPEGGRNYNVLIACGGLQEDARLVNNKNYPEIAEHFAQSIAKYKTFKPDVFLAAHSWFFDLAGKYKRLGSATNPYVDPAGYRAWVANMEKNYNTLIAEQKKNPPSN